MQAKLMWFMPLAFSVMFFFFPAGLVLYWITNNMLSIAQQWFINTRHGRAAASSTCRTSAGRSLPGVARAGPVAFAAASNAGPCCAHASDPIVAIATAPGAGRLASSGCRADGLAPLIEAVCARPLKPREATYLPFLDERGRGHRPRTGDSLPGAALLHRRRRAGVAGPRRPGGAAAAAGALPGGGCRDRRRQRPARLAGLRVAQPGEFSQRAFLNGKIDLAQAEAIADLIDASTEAAARGAGRSLVGRVLARDPRAARALIMLRMLVEATLDFPEEEIDFLQRADAAGQLEDLRERLAERARASASGRAAARGHPGRHRRSAQRRQELAAQCAGRRRTGHRKRRCRGPRVTW